MKNSLIQWCDHTFNGWIGCTFARLADGTPIPECFLCYAKDLDDQRFSKTMDGGSKEHPISHWGDKAPRHRTSASNWNEPLKWNERPWICDDCGTALREKFEIHPCGTLGEKYSAMTRRARIFCLSLGDWLDDKVPIEWLADLLKLIHDTPNLDWLLLTKRPQNWNTRMKAINDLMIASAATDAYDVKLDCWIGDWREGKPPANVWIGVSAGADQAAALDIPAVIHFLSCEPMLRPLVAFAKCECVDCGSTWTGPTGTSNGLTRCQCGSLAIRERHFDWIILGGESGNPKHVNPKKRPRPFDLIDLYNGLSFCIEHRIAAFVKQMGSNPRFSHDLYRSGLLVNYGWAPHVTFPCSPESVPPLVPGAAASEGHMIKLRDGHGGDMAEWPVQFHVREFPTPRP